MASADPDRTAVSGNLIAAVGFRRGTIHLHVILGFGRFREFRNSLIEFMELLDRPLPLKSSRHLQVQIEYSKSHTFCRVSYDQRRDIMDRVRLEHVDTRPAPICSSHADWNDRCNLWLPLLVSRQ